MKLLFSSSLANFSRVCTSCHSSFVPRVVHQVTCSSACGRQRTRTLEIQKRREVRELILCTLPPAECERCKALFKRTKLSGRRRRFCGDTCKHAAGVAARKAKGTYRRYGKGTRKRKMSTNNATKLTPLTAVRRWARPTSSSFASCLFERLPNSRWSSLCGIWSAQRIDEQLHPLERCVKCTQKETTDECP